ncbi:prepilin-type N-terminal cleavage/methylation domain-containing protein [Caenimonas sedimenti]|uniref:Prepilin-type N-terminal cleavage/methylation domain-containing protein n=1 Tax=Caenimonas sedimenti TaxID=2596921 RepID=A0A562ZGU3_9BURK|nr:pilin [Caenimonas sedimenti]TWO67003.1 prepilin-type N-terminal cleavage/methylation domain-containing protein [Caenimonas sedimenti]
MNACRGFSLLELLAALAVMCILLLIALPSYTDRIVREQVVEALPLANLAKPAVEAAWRNGEPLPADNAAAGLPAGDKIVNAVVTSVTLQDGAVHIVFGHRAHPSLRGRTLTLRPAGVEDARVVPVVWLCGRAAPPPPMAAHGTDRTDVPAGLLPLRCR